MTGQALVLVLPTCQRKRTGLKAYLSLPSSLSLKCKDCVALQILTHVLNII